MENITNNEKKAENKPLEFLLLYHSFSKAYRRQMIKTAADNGLFMGQPPILMLLIKKDGRTQRELSDFLGIRPASMTDVLQRMEKNGLIERKRDERDHRTMRVFITEEGREKSCAILEQGASMEEVFFRGFSRAEQNCFLKAFEQITKNIKEEYGEE